MKNESACLIALAAGLFATTSPAVASTVERADFAGGGAPEGWTVENSAYCSPKYSGAVDRIELSYHGFAANGSATVYALSNNVETQVAILSAASSAAAFDFPDTTDFRSFRIATENGLSLSSFTAYVSASVMEAPVGVAVSNNVTGTSFDAYWNPVADATGYRVYVWTNAVVGASAGTEVWVDDFSKAAAGSTSAKAVDSGNFNTSYSDTTFWVCNEYVYPSTTNGAIRLGASDRGKNGSLMSPHLPAGDHYLRMRAWRYSADDGTDMPIIRNSGGITSLVQIVTFTKDPGVPEDFMIKLPTLMDGDHLMFCSFTNKKPRVILDRLAIVSGYSEGQEEPSYIINGQDVGAATSCSFAGLPSVPVRFAVEAYGRRGVSSAKTDAVEIDLANPDKAAALNACPISSLADKTYTQNFDSLSALTATTGDKEWLNGTTLQYWQAYKGSSAVAAFKYNGGAGNTGGLYALATNQNHTVRALGAYSSQNDEFSFGIAFTNDTGEAVRLSALSYVAQQWGFKNDTNQTLSVSVLVTNSLDWIATFDDGWTELGSTQSYVYGEGVAHDTPVSTPVTVEQEAGVSVAPGQVLMLKWTIHSLKSGKPGMMAIDNLEVRFAPASRSFVISIVKH